MRNALVRAYLRALRHFKFFSNWRRVIAGTKKEVISSQKAVLKISITKHTWIISFCDAWVVVMVLQGTYPKVLVKVANKSFSYNSATSIISLHCFHDEKSWLFSNAKLASSKHNQQKRKNAILS